MAGPKTIGMKLRKLTRAEIEAGGAAMPAVMKYHDKLWAQVLEAVEPVEPDGEYPGCDLLVFSHGSFLSPQYDDEGNPGFCDWELADHDGIGLVGGEVRDLIGKRVFGVGYLHDPDSSYRAVIPYVLFENRVMLVCLTPNGGAVIHHQRPSERTWDLFCQFTPKPQEPPTQKETQPMAMTPPEYDPTDAEEQTDKVVQFPEPEPQEPGTIEDLLVMVQDARTQVRDLSKALGDIASFIRSQKKQDKQLRSELANARGVLEKLRDIAA